MRCILCKALCLALGAILLLGLAVGCAKQPPAPPALTYAELLATVKQTSEGGISDYLTSCYLYTMQEDRLWACGRGRDENDVVHFRLVSMDIHTEETVCQDLTLPPSLWGEDPAQTFYPDIYQFCIDPDGGLWFLLEERLLDIPQGLAIEEWDWEKVVDPLQLTYSLCALGEDGTLHRTGQLQMPPEVELAEGEYWSGSANSATIAMCVTEDGLFNMLWTRMIPAENNSFHYGDTYLLRSAPDGSCKEALLVGPDRPSNGPWQLADGSLLFLNGRQMDYMPQMIRVSGRAEGQSEMAVLEMPGLLTEDISLRVIQNTPFSGGSQAQADVLPMIFGLNGVYQLDEELKTATTLLNWEDYNIDGSQLDSVISLGEGRFLVYVRGQGFVKLLPMTDDLLAERQVVTLGVDDGGLSKQLKKAVQDYNFAEPEVYIQTVDYSDRAAQAAGFDSGSAMLTDAILHGTAPDILLVASDLGSQHLVRQGLFVDLYPYLDADAELKRDDFVPGMLATCAFDGALPTVMPAATLLTVAAAPAAAGADPGWTWQQYTDSCAALPDLQMPFYPFDRGTVLHWQLQLSGSDFINYAAGKCYFDTPAFEALLTASAALPTEAADMTADPKPLFQQGQALADISIVNNFSTLKTLRYLFDGDFVFKGFPTDSENATGSAFTPVLRLGITRYCQDPDAAWGFLRTLLLPGFQNALQNALPLRQDSLTALADAAQQPTENAQPPSFFAPDSLTDSQKAYWQQGAEAGDCQKLLDAVQATHTLYQYDGVIFGILQEEADYFYNGVRTAHEAAAIIQDRVQTYLDERG